MLLGVLHLFGEYLLQRRQAPARLLQFHKPRLAVRHTGDAVGDAAVVNAAELVRVAAQRFDAPHEMRLYLFLGHGLWIVKHFLSCNTFFVVYAGLPNSKVRYSNGTT